jgi:alpha-D-ribose 1-methylphosphonate 5-triphosphate synthase subunit PhnI
MYVAVKGGERAIEASWRLLDKSRRGDTRLAELSVGQIREQLRLSVARVMTEGSVYDEDLAALAIKQAAGDLVEAIFLLRAYRTTLPRFGYTQPLDSETMVVERRISATFKDLPGGQLLGATYDYTQRLLDFKLMAEAQANGGDSTSGHAAQQTRAALQETPEAMPRVVTLLNKEGLIEQETPLTGTPEPGDLTREPCNAFAEPGARRRRLPAGDGLCDAARLRELASVRGRDPFWLGDGRDGTRRTRRSGGNR